MSGYLILIASEIFILIMLALCISGAILAYIKKLEENKADEKYNTRWYDKERSK